MCFGCSKEPSLFATQISMIIKILFECVIIFSHLAYFWQKLPIKRCFRAMIYKNNHNIKDKNKHLDFIFTRSKGSGQTRAVQACLSFSYPSI